MRIKLLMLATVAHRQRTKIPSGAWTQDMPMVSSVFCLPPKAAQVCVVVVFFTDSVENASMWYRFGTFILKLLKVESGFTWLSQMNIQTSNTWHIRKDCDCWILERINCLDICLISNSATIWLYIWWPLIVF